MLSESYRKRIVELSGIKTPGELNDNFKLWFKNSKVVTSDDKPLIVYHGTSSDFVVFKPSKSTGNQGENDQIKGMYFTDSKDGASFFSLSDDDKYLKSFFLSIQNPYFVNDYNTLKNNLEVNSLSKIDEKLKKMGYDGLIMTNGFYANGGPFKLFLVFYPNQIKSVMNDGSWDSSDSNIYS